MAKTGKINGSPKAVEQVLGGEALSFQHYPRLVKADFRGIVLRRQAMAERKAALEEELKTANQVLAELLEREKAKSVMVGDLRVTRVESPGASRLDKHRLLELGVPADTLACATISGTPYVTVMVKDIKGGDK